MHHDITIKQKKGKNNFESHIPIRGMRCWAFVYANQNNTRYTDASYFWHNMNTNEIIIQRLKQQYPHAHIALQYSTPWELLVAVILSAQCTDTMVNIVTSKLFRKYPILDAYVNADSTEFEKDIKSTGFYRNKTKHILQTARIIKETYGGIIPQTIETLILLPGVMRKTANVVLSNAYGINEGIAVDTHVIRISQRLRLVDISAVGGKQARYIQNDIGDHVVDFIKDADPVKIEKQLMETIPKELWHTATYVIIDHGRAICKAQHPNCCECVLKDVCVVSRG